MRKVMKKYQLNFTSYLDPLSVVSDKFMVNTYPVSILYHKGKVIYVSKKVHDFMADDFTSMVSEKLKGK